MTEQVQAVISKQELFRMSCCACDEILQIEEFHSELVRDALVQFSRRLENKIFAPPAERYYTSQKIRNLLDDLRRTGKYPVRNKNE